MGGKACAAHTCKTAVTDSCQDFLTGDVADVSSPFIIGKFCVYFRISFFLYNTCHDAASLFLNLFYFKNFTAYAGVKGSGHERFRFSDQLAFFYMISGTDKKTALSSK